VLTALLSFFIALGILYESLVHPLTIISTLPSASWGAMSALMLFHSDLNVISISGNILLMGITPLLHSFRTFHSLTPLTFLILSRLGTRGGSANSGLTKPRYAYFGQVYAPPARGGRATGGTFPLGPG